MIWITINNVQRAITPKAGNSELLFLCFAKCIIVIYICIKFHENISNSFQATEWTQIYYRYHYFQSSKGINSKSRLTRVTFFVFCILSHDTHDALNLCEVSSKYLERVFNFQYLLCSKGSNSKSTLTRVMVFVLCMVLYICEKFIIITNGFQLTERTSTW